MDPFHSNKSFTFAFQNRKNIVVIALSPKGDILISVDEGAQFKTFSVSIASIHPQ